MTAMRRLAVIALLALAIASGVIAWIVWPDGGAESQVAFDPAAVQPVLSQLAPGTTFHTVEILYRRYGAEAVDVPPEEGPETQRSEGWMTFGDDGTLVDVRAETRGTDGTLVSTVGLEGDDFVLRDASGAELLRVSGFRQKTTVETLKASIGAVTTELYNRLLNQPDAPTGSLDGLAVVVLEDRRPIRGGAAVAPEGAVSEGFRLPYVADLSPAEEVRREYVQPDEFRGVRSEVVIVSGDGTETVVESREFEIYEVVAAVP